MSIIRNYFEKQNKTPKAIVILPGIGCGGCITSVEDFLRNNYENNNGIKFILTSVVSKKILKTKLGIDLNHNNILLDDQNYFSRGIFDSIYPIVLFFDKKGDIENIKYVSPKEDGLSFLVENI